MASKYIIMIIIIFEIIVGCSSYNQDNEIDSLKRVFVEKIIHNPDDLINIIKTSGFKIKHDYLVKEMPVFMLEHNTKPYQEFIKFNDLINKSSGVKIKCESKNKVYDEGLWHIYKVHCKYKEGSYFIDILFIFDGKEWIFSQIRLSELSNCW